MSIVCPLLPCPIEKQITEVNECCNYCQGNGDRAFSFNFLDDLFDVCHLSLFQKQMPTIVLWAISVTKKRAA